MKKIVFICGSIEEGKDGVGDYTRRLSTELIKEGKEVKIIALNDKYLSTFWEGYQTQDNTDVSVIRFPANSQWKYRIQKTTDIIKEFNPDWISLQYVPYSFDERGLTLRLAGYLKKVSGDSKWHIMFHELWIGIDEQASLKNKWIGKIQRLLTKRMASILKPKLIHTQTTLYQYMLGKIGVTAALLPLFGNIPPPAYTDFNRRKDSMQGLLAFVVFGGIHYGAPIKDFAREIAQTAQQLKRKGLVTFMGRGGAELNIWLAECELAGLATKSLGEQNTQIISSTLSASNFGIATTPYLLVEKSGSVAAMLEHGLPVICVARNWKPHGNFAMSFQTDVYEYKVGNLNAILTSQQHILSPVTLLNVVTKFINDLT